MNERLKKVVDTVNRNADTSEDIEDEEISNKYDLRLDLPEDKWIHLPPGVSVIEYYKENKAIDLFIKKEVSLSKAAELSGISLNDFIHLLKSKNIPWTDYTEEDYEMDNIALELLNRTNKEVNELKNEIKESLSDTKFLHSDESYLEMKTDKKVVMKMIQDGRSDEEIKRVFEEFPDNLIKIMREQMKKGTQLRTGRGIKIEVTDDISHMGLTEREYETLQHHVDPELKNEVFPHFILVVNFEGPEEVSLFSTIEECIELITSLLETGVSEKQFRLFKVHEEINWKKLIDVEVK
ncbi:UPF0175 family protein [Anaerobacillus isosaccharinicus]|uniref:UPF0175 family protein n=1 Tax=Anaerobacillus isosaccharinicus TaxID=1532552 RepID=A0A1S2M712_9BACI|nr:UPF0175 family protein [Anaerobacillus isosaccharinicus]MBA5587079.1 UPF0175 family protein [Anaerobacillus isosaccharinicus]QOY34725.1 UPF0175 family protein [Anaerobacillus isosaccharinicus]